MRTFSTTNNVDDDRVLEYRNDSLSPQKPRAISEHLSLERTVIDCTSTTPVMKTLTREFDLNYPLKGLQQTNTHHQKETNSRTVIGKDLRIVCALPAVAKESPEEENVPIKSDQRPVTRRESKLSSSSSSQLETSNERTPKNCGEEFKNSNSNETKVESARVSTEKSRQNPHYFAEKQSAVDHYSSPRNNKEVPKGVSTSAVQTELTCIPVRGLRHRWNSVETLIPPQYPSPPVRKLGTTRRDEESHRHTLTRGGEHTLERRCHCEECFYIWVNCRVGKLNFNLWLIIDTPAMNLPLNTSVLCSLERSVFRKQIWKA